MGTLSPDQAALAVAIVSAVSALFGATLGAVVSYLISRQQLRAAVRSGNRQEWINTVRDTVAEITALSLTLLGVYRARPNDPALLSAFADRANRLAFLYRKLELLINPLESDHNALIQRMGGYVSGTLALMNGKEDDRSLRDLPDSGEITAITQRILKREWERVKQGE